MRRVGIAVLVPFVLGAVAACTRSGAPPGPEPATPPGAAATAQTGETAAEPPGGDARAGSPVQPEGEGARPACTGRDTAVGAVLDLRELPPPASGGPPSPADGPVLTSASVGLFETYEAGGGRVLGYKTLVRSGEAAVGTDEFGLTFRLEPWPGEVWVRQNLRVEGVTVAPRLQEDPPGGGGGYVQVNVPPGREGDRVHVVLRGIVWPDGRPGPLALTLCRRSEPRASLFVRQGEAWLPASPDEVVEGAGPLALRVVFTSPMDRATVEAALRAAASPEHRPDAAQWRDDRTVELVYRVPPPVATVNLDGARDQHGLWLVGSLPAVYAGRAPHLAAVDPGSGAEVRVVPVVPEVADLVMAPGGDRLAVRANRRRARGASPVLWLVDVASGRRAEVAGEGGTPDPRLFWVDGGRLLVLRRAPQPGWALYGPSGEREAAGELPDHWTGALSPDGQRLALTRLTAGADAEAERSGYLAPFDLLITDRAGNVLRTIPRAIRAYRPPTEWVVQAQPAWAPDGRHVALLSDGPGDAVDLVRVDVEEGSVQVVRAGVEGARFGTTYPLAWSPDGNRIAAGGLVLEAATGQVERRLADPPGAVRAVFWSPDGSWLLFQDAEWGEVRAYHVATGRVRALGQGLPVGWDARGRALIVRWDGAAHRWVPECC